MLLTVDIINKCEKNTIIDSGYYYDKYLVDRPLAWCAIKLHMTFWTVKTEYSNWNPAFPEYEKYGVRDIDIPPWNTYQVMRWGNPVTDIDIVKQFVKIDCNDVIRSYYYG